MADIEEIIVLRLTREEAFALDDLADGAMNRLASDRKLLAAYARMDGNLQTVARACDKLHGAVMDEPDTLLWTKLIQQVPQKPSIGEDDGLTTEAAFEQYAQRGPSVLEAERQRIAKGHEPDIALEIWGPQIEAEIEVELTRKPKA